MGVSTVRGEFREFDGALEVGEDGDAPRPRHVKAASVHTNQDQRDEHLRSADFFDVENYPELTVRVDQHRAGRRRELQDRRRPDHPRGHEPRSSSNAELGGVDFGMEGEHRTGLEVTGQLSRKDYGMKFSAALGSGNAVVADKVKLALDVEAVRQDA